MYQNPGPPPTVTTPDGVTFRRMPDEADAVYVVGEYRFDDIRPEDIVLDIGANVGAFCIRAARRSRRVLAVEPVLTGALQENVRANGACVTVVGGALGGGGTERITWGSRTLTVATRTLGEFAGMIGGCDFLKCDCEGRSGRSGQKTSMGCAASRWNSTCPRSAGRSTAHSSTTSGSTMTSRSTGRPATTCWASWGSCTPSRRAGTPEPPAAVQVPGKTPEYRKNTRTPVIRARPACINRIPVLPPRR